MRILIVASEASPFAKAGGLGDVVGALPAALKDLGCDVSVAIPAYRTALAKIQDHEVAAENVPVQLGPWRIEADVLRADMDQEVPLYLIRKDEFFDRWEIYGPGREEYFDNPERYIFFSKSIPGLCKVVNLEPDVILANDWQTGLVMALLAEGNLPRTAGVFTIHNLGYLGLVPPERIPHIGLPDEYFGMDGLEFYGQMSLLKAGIVYSQAVTTVSPSYAKEIQTSAFGCGLEGLLRSVKKRLYGVLNGIDEKEWNPATDKHLKTHYSVKDLSGKKKCKEALIKEKGLSRKLMNRPLIGMVTRLVSQKGCELIAKAGAKIMESDVGLVVLGSGEAKYEQALERLQKKHPVRVGLTLGFDESQAHRIFAGCDMTLVPSLYEPCGLTQMYGLRYGTLPIVRATGGLNDTVQDPLEGYNPGTGFKFEKFKPGDLLKTVRRAVETYFDTKRFKAMRKEAMTQDFTWHKSAESYLKVFEKAVAERRKPER